MEFPDFGPGCPWYEAFEKYGAPNVKWCERTICSIANEPVNAWTNLAYIGFAMILFFQGLKKAKSGKNNRADLHFGLTIFLMGGCSFIYHATNNFFTQVLDFVGMYLFVFLVLVMNLVRLGWIRKNLLFFHLLFVGLGTGLVFVLRWFNLAYQPLILIFGLLIVISEWKLSIKEPTVAVPRRNFYRAIGWVVIASIFSFLDISRTVCFPDSWFQGHGMWHLCGSIGLYYLAQYYIAIDQVIIENQSRVHVNTEPF